MERVQTSKPLPKPIRKKRPVEVCLIVNPFAKREMYDKKSVVAYRALTILTWLLVIALCLAYTVKDSLGARTIQCQNAAHPTPFALHPVITGVYW